MSERSRGPEGASSPASTQSGPSGGDDIYAAAAASAAGRNAKRSASARPARSAGSAPEAQTDGTSTAARAQPVDDDARSAQANGSRNGGAPDTATQPAANGNAAGATAGTESGGEPTSKLSAVASSVLGRVRSGGKSDPAKPDPAKSDESKSDAAKSAGQQPATGKTAAGAGATATAAAGATAAKNTATTQRSSADPANEPTTAMNREPVGPPASATAGADSADPAKADKPKVGTARGTRKARLRLSRLDPWSVMKTAFLFSIAAGIVMVVAVYAVWLVIGSSGLFDSVDSIVGSVLQSPGDTTPFRIEDYVNTQKVMGVTAFLACIDVVIFTALATLASFLYNLAATMLGGLEVTLAED
ncbi:DUF3566 domain-containing protein [Microlunatus soli]|uniref:DUF3566 domain-containing protein n=1 Tax=Microlunatus soli TaxID=630515 RepID=A0A1H1UHC5_9ACTN|nr:DUF3566 domain-containing protein [Microlunatus soli]SDS71944.1 Transmembrane protein of unknown function [Microlunatus soli]